MLTKNPKSKFIKYVKRGALVAFVAEALCFAVSYAGYHRLNTNRDFRLYMRDNYPPILDFYYKIGETFGDLRTRENDKAIWRATQSIK